MSKTFSMSTGPFTISKCKLCVGRIFETHWYGNTKLSTLHILIFQKFIFGYKLVNELKDLFCFWGSVWSQFQFVKTQLIWLSGQKSTNQVPKYNSVKQKKPRKYKFNFDFPTDTLAIQHVQSLSQNLNQPSTNLPPPIYMYLCVLMWIYVYLYMFCMFKCM